MTPIMLADSRAVRAQVYNRFAWKGGVGRQAAATQTRNQLALQIGSIRSAGYNVRLSEFATQLGVNHPAQLTDAVRLASIAQDARATATASLQTYNRDLRAFIARQPAGESAAALSTRVKTWQQERAQWKARQIARAETVRGRDQANSDVLAHNSLAVLERAEPLDAQCPLCQALVARGWQRPDQRGAALPLHPNCRHAWVPQESIRAQVAGKDRVWLGQWAPTGKQGA